MSTRRNYPGSNMHNRNWNPNNENQNNNENYGHQNRFQQQRYEGPQNSLDLRNRSLYDNQHQGWGGNQYSNQQGPQSRWGSSHGYNNETGRNQNRASYNNPYDNSRYNRNDDRGFLDRAGETLRAGWNQLTGGEHNDRDYNRNGNYGPYDHGGSSYRNNYGSSRNDDRNFFERTGDRIRQGWNELTNEWTDDRDRFRQEGREYDSYNSNRPTNENREYRMGPTSEYDYEKNMNRRRYNRNDSWDL